MSAIVLWSSVDPFEWHQWYIRFLQESKARHIKMMEFGVSQGWWLSYDDKGPHPWPTIYKIGSGNFKYISQILVLLGAFPNRREAIKAGWEKPIMPGEYWHKKHRMGAIHLIIE